MDRKVLLAFIIALIAIIVVGFVALHFVPTNNIINGNVTDNISNITENSSINVSENSTDIQLNVTPNETAVNATVNLTNLTDQNANDTNTSSDSIDSGDVLKKQTFTISENETGQNAGMEPGTYVMYYTENDGPIKIQKIA